MVLARTVTENDLRAVIGEMVKQARAGEQWAVCELLDRCLGKSVEPTALEGEMQVCRIRLEVDEGPAARVSRDDA